MYKFQLQIVQVAYNPFANFKICTIYQLKTAQNPQISSLLSEIIFYSFETSIDEALYFLHVHNAKKTQKLISKPMSGNV